MSGDYRVGSFEEYLRVVRDEIKVEHKYFRGQTRLVRDGYKLLPSIGRYDRLRKCNLMEGTILERQVLQVFSNHLLAYVQHLPRNDWECLAIAQHHGVPTRFMDWTTNPLVGLYFATRETKKDGNGGSVDSAVYVLISEPLRHPSISPKEGEVEEPQKGTSSSETDPYAEVENLSPTSEDKSVEGTTATEEHNTEEEISPFDISENIIYDPPHVSPRIRSQDGVLLACWQPTEPLDEEEYIEIVIKNEAHDDIRRRLLQYGVFDKQLFPDLDGIAKWLKYRVFEINDII